MAPDEELLKKYSLNELEDLVKAKSKQIKTDEIKKLKEKRRSLKKEITKIDRQIKKLQSRRKRKRLRKGSAKKQ